MRTSISRYPNRCRGIFLPTEPENAILFTVKINFTTSETTHCETINREYNPKWEGETLHGGTPPFHSGIDTDAASRHTLCSCWYAQPNQSVSMWDRYGNEGIAIKTTVKRIKEGVDGYGKIFRIGKIKYIDYDNDDDFGLEIRWENRQPRYDSNFNYRRFLHKQTEYKDEDEVRLIMLAEYHCDILLQFINRSEANQIPLVIDKEWKNSWGCLEIPMNGIYLPIKPGILMKKIFVSNRAEPFVKKLIEQQLEEMNIQPRPKIEQTKLLQRQHIWA